MEREEKEAIEYIKAFQKDLYGASEKNLMAIYIDRVWNYIDKLQRENEHELEQRKFWRNSFYNLKDKIRDKIKELEREYNKCTREDTFMKAKLLYQTNILEELLKEE